MSNKNEKKFRLEFNEVQQNFHYTDDDNNLIGASFGWELIAENITENDYFIFDSYLNCVEDSVHTVDSIKQSYHFLQKFIAELDKYDFVITSKN